jgi:hypothetical protein
MPDESGVTVVTMLVCFFVFAREAAGASSVRHSLRPAEFSGALHDWQNSRGSRGEIADVWLQPTARSQ